MKNDSVVPNSAGLRGLFTIDLLYSNQAFHLQHVLKSVEIKAKDGLGNMPEHHIAMPLALSKKWESCCRGSSLTF